MTPKKVQERRAVVYVRLSQDRTGEKESPQTQEKNCRAYCERQGWEVVKVFEDRDVSGFKRVATPGLDAALEAIGSGRANTLVVWKLDRLTRRGLARAAAILGELEEAGAAFVSTVESIDTTTSAGRIVFAILAEQARSESESISTRVSAAMAREKAKGRPNFGQRTFGYNLEGSRADARLVVNEQEAGILREVARRIVAGESLRKLAYDLNRRGVRTAQGKLWSRRRALARRYGPRSSAPNTRTATVATGPLSSARQNQRGSRRP